MALYIITYRAFFSEPTTKDNIVEMCITGYGIMITLFTAHGKAKVQLSHVLQTELPTIPWYSQLYTLRTMPTTTESNSFFHRTRFALQKEIIGWNGDKGTCIEHSGKVEETDWGRICRACVSVCWRYGVITNWDIMV